MNVFKINFSHRWNSKGKHSVTVKVCYSKITKTNNIHSDEHIAIIRSSLARADIHNFYSVWKVNMYQVYIARYILVGWSVYKCFRYWL